MFARTCAGARAAGWQMNEIHKKIIKTRQFPGSKRPQGRYKRFTVPYRYCKPQSIYKNISPLLSSPPATPPLMAAALAGRGVPWHDGRCPP